MSYKLTDEELISLDSEKITDIVGEKTNSEDLNKVSIILTYRLVSAREGFL